MAEIYPDPKMPWLPFVLDPQLVQPHFTTIFPTVRRVIKAELLRHKIGRRALIAYYLETDAGEQIILGKIRAKGTDYKSYGYQRALWENGFHGDSEDGLSVPEPLGIVEPWRMWLQRWVPGQPATNLLITQPGLPEKIAALAHKLHTHSVPTQKTHTIADELQILGDRLRDFAHQQPQWQTQIQYFIAQSERLGQILEQHPRPSTTIHRDFYPDQILVEGDRLWLVDLDLYCQGDPAVDLGNFIAHMTEQSLRTWGDPNAMVSQEQTLKAAFLAKQPPESSHLSQAIDVYANLTLLRHIAISWRIPERRPNIPTLLELCGDRLTEQLHQIR
ncbi:phosphotransferase family protein [Picosynechococcus sp. PCC 73109]|uniref:phosphotransferase family protein n=1 Tax=Picosynechococcus sp. PCC 73109 TaxID=374982 RepID=UPI00074584F4|nr:phosphotransferase [Picosynechococcus sp. PCC 73109]AMA09160.1 phosphotransferase [Picosynechococcus sp. PCC 73109]